MGAPLVLILGATGQIGGLVMKELVADQAAGRLRLAGLARSGASGAALEKQGIEARILDLDRVELEGLGPIGAALQGVDRLFLLTSYDVRMLAQSKAVVDAAKAEGVGHILHLGAHAAAETTVVHLGWHQMIEAYIRQTGIPATYLHPTSFMQNLPMLFQIGGRKQGIIRHYTGTGRQSWIDAQDVASVAACILRDPASHAGQSYSLGTENLSMNEVAAKLSEATGQPWRDESRPPAEFLEQVTAAGADPVYMRCVANIFTRVADGGLPDLEETFDTVERLLSRPGISMSTFLGRNRAAFVD